MRDRLLELSTARAAQRHANDKRRKLCAASDRRRVAFGNRQRARNQEFSRFLHRSVRHTCAPSWCRRAAIDKMAREGAGFAGFATWLDMTPADARPVRHARSRQPHPAAVEARSRLARRRSLHGRQAGRAGAAQRAEAADRAGAANSATRCAPASNANSSCSRPTARRSPTAPTRSRSPATTSRR